MVGTGETASGLVAKRGVVAAVGRTSSMGEGMACRDVVPGETGSNRPFATTP